MRIIVISDTHGRHNNMTYHVENFIDKNQDTYLIHAGDISNVGEETDVTKFVHWFQNLKGFSSKIFIAGNHDLSFENKEPWLHHLINDENLSQSDCYYLEDSFMTITDPEFSTPIKIYGSPWQPRFFDWAFNVDRDKIHVYWEKIPEDTSILITHGPVNGMVDKVINRSEHLGCKSLYEHILRVKPKIHICGHIHSGNGAIETNDTVFINASICTEQYKPIQKPIIVDLTEVDGKLIAKIV